MGSAAIFGCEGISLTLGGRAILKDVGLQVSRGEVLGLIGESGAGKTESAKYMIKHIITLCHTGAEGAALENKIIQVSTLLLFVSSGQQTHD